jgi:hypothetical protein
MDILILNISIWILKSIFQPEISIPNYYFGSLELILPVWKLIESKNGHFNFEYYYLNLKIYISILEIFI